MRLRTEKYLFNIMGIDKGEKMIKKIIDLYFSKILANELIKDLKIKTFFKYDYKIIRHKAGFIILCNRKNCDHYITIYKCKYKDAPCIYCHSYFKNLESAFQAVRIYYEE